MPNTEVLKELDLLQGLQGLEMGRGKEGIWWLADAGWQAGRNEVAETTTGCRIEVDILQVNELIEGRCAGEWSVSRGSHTHTKTHIQRQ